MSNNLEHHRDRDHLRTLSIFFYIVAGMSSLSGCLLSGFAMFGIAIMAGAIEGVAPEVAILAGLILTIIESALAILVWTMALLEVMTGRSLATHTRYRLCFVMSCIELINFPFGTTVAVFTLVVLSRPSVQALFAGIPFRDPRLDAFDEAEDGEDEPRASPSAASDDGSIRKGDPTP